MTLSLKTLKYYTRLGLKKMKCKACGLVISTNALARSGHDNGNVCHDRQQAAHDKAPFMTTYFLVMSTGIIRGVFEAVPEAVVLAKSLSIPVIFKARLFGRPMVGRLITPQVDWDTIPISR
jgi:hypothetical protein